MIDTTVMMTTYNRLDLTKKTMDDFAENTGCEFNLVIVDNGSTDGTVGYLNKLKLAYSMQSHSGKHVNKEVHLILLPENKGIAIGRNLALKKADELNTKWYCTIDPDVKMPKGWLEESINILKANRDYGAIGVNMENKPYPLVNSKGYTFQEKPSGNLGTAAMVFRKELHQMIGFFNTEYGKYGEEDADFGVRARVAGFKLGYIERMGIHLGADESDVCEYRKFKTKQHNDNWDLFRKNCGLYSQRKKPLMIPFKDN